VTQKQDLSQLIADVKEQVLYLQELGVETLDVSLSERPAETSDSTFDAPRALRTIPAVPNTTGPTPAMAEPRPIGSRLASLPSLSQRSAPASPPRAPTSPPVVKIEIASQPATQIKPAPPMPEPTETIEQIRAEIGPHCTRCKLSTLGRKQVVNSTGNFNARLMFAGEAPGADEDEQGFPFVGRAGKLLTDIMMAIGFNREDVFIGNINRCRPPGNRAPEPDETAACKPFLKREVAVVRPKVIVVLGATAAQNLLETKVPIGKLRGHFHDYLGVKVMPTFHPAYLLRDPHKKREVWEDMKLVRDYLSSLD
jgi:uracil-DNA glycosylase family 4